MSNYICALDLGSSRICAVLAKVRKGRIENLYFDFVASKGIQKGSIVNSMDVVECVSGLLKNLKSKSGINIRFVYANISGQDIDIRRSHAIMPLAERGNKLITKSDIEKVNEQARILGLSLEDEILHMVPINYNIDSKNNLVNPIGLYSHRLEAEVLLICANSSSVQNLVRVISQSGYDLKGLFFSGIATSRVVFGSELKEGLNLFCDIGSDKTELIIFEGSRIKFLEILPLGSKSLTAQLQNKLNLPFDLAEDIKRSYAIIAESHNIPEDKEILLRNDNLYKPIKQRLVAEIVTSEAKLICSKIREAVEKAIKIYELNNFIVVGRTVLLEGFIETLENSFSIPVKLGRIVNPQILFPINKERALTIAKSMTYLTALGIICEVLQDKSEGILLSKKPARNLLSKAVNLLKEVYQEYF